MVQIRMRSFNVSAGHLNGEQAGRGREYDEKAMKGDEGSSENPSLLPESQSTNKKYDVKHEVMMT